MSFDSTDSKGSPGQVYPDGVDVDYGNANWGRLAPLITAQEVKDKYLFGLDLISGTMDSITRRRQVYTIDMIRDKIDDAVASAELETGIQIMPAQFTKKMPFDLHEYRSMGYMRLPHRPVFSVERFDIVLANDSVLYSCPMDWLELGNLYAGQLNLLPLTVALANQGAQIPTSAAAASVVLTLLQNQSWVPSFWQVKFTCGFPSGKVPKFINDLVGTITACEVLSMLAATYARNQSASLSIDGLSQSSSTPGPKIFADRLNDLMLKRKMLVKKTKTIFGLNWFSGNV